jgi:hypothetical protein
MEDKKTLKDCTCGKKTAVQYVSGPYHGEECPKWAKNPPEPRKAGEEWDRKMRFKNEKGKEKGK